jgi:hypothetical protein
VAKSSKEHEAAMMYHLRLASSHKLKVSHSLISKEDKQSHKEAAKEHNYAAKAHKLAMDKSFKFKPNSGSTYGDAANNASANANSWEKGDYKIGRGL